jgi:hypothetical protein
MARYKSTPLAAVSEIHSKFLYLLHDLLQTLEGREVVVVWRGE